MESSDSECDMIVCNVTDGSDCENKSHKETSDNVIRNAMSDTGNKTKKAVHLNRTFPIKTDDTNTSTEYARKRSGFHTRNEYVSSNSTLEHSQRRDRQEPPVHLDNMRMAVMQGNLNVLSSILGEDINIDTVLKAGWTALMYACSCGHHEIVEFLLKKNANPNFHKDAFTPLMAACASRKDEEEDLLKCVEYLLEYGADANIWERHQMTPLMFAAREGRSKIIQKLIEYGTDLNRQDNRGWTALAWAANRGHGLVVRTLLDARADPNLVSLSGQKPAELAFSQGHNMIGEILENLSMKTQRELSDSDKQKLEEVEGQSNPLLTTTSSSSEKQDSKYMRFGDLEMFLSSLELSALIPVFHDHQINFHDLLLMTEHDLEKVGVDKFGVRKKILDAIHEVHEKKWEKSSLPDLKQKKYISCPDAVALMANIAQHLSYIQSTVLYLRKQIQNQPRLLELGQEINNIQQLTKETYQSMKNIQSLQEEINCLKMHLYKIQNNVQYLPADIIKGQSDEHQTSQNKSKKIIVIGLGTIAVGIMGSLLWKNHEKLQILWTFRK
ncbi:ankyrin repeat, SAM and basic leucine zipper domain-containing protein 1-like isoform X1 [Limulus polyphemus]|uniref:Ankyrin repeat, SAM and basic leucine zipper domain-containing protein 1 n=1 Tax=Limulus polyphemus TaxID=6850 RepID=A0ABM1B536_LIMPO|nr:ankyrin repeat, SAM and basic leucine zipper domain-containing protein 1-like isoform X1 [Limulus polyphemus]